MAEVFTIDPLLGLVAVLVLIALNGIFVAGEFSLVAVDIERVELTRELRQGQPVMTSDRPLDGWVSIYEASTDTFMGVGEVLEDGRIAPRRLVSG